MSDATVAKKPRETDDVPVPPTLRKSLKNRHIQLIALGGAIGTGLFYGSSESIQLAGPAILLAYLIGGLAIFLIVRALSEMAVEDPKAGAFSYYATQYWSKRAGFISGWNYWFNYVLVAMVELAVVGSFVNYWFPNIPKWVSAAVFLVAIAALNLMGVNKFGEFEFWFAIIKIVAVLAMIFGGLYVIIANVPTASGIRASFANWFTVDGGFLPHGLMSRNADGTWTGLLMALVVVMFSFGGTELIGITAGETENPRTTIPKATNGIIWRILVFYICALGVIMAVVPWSTIDGNSSPFVQIFDSVGVHAAAGILNFVCLTAVMSVYNSGLYANSRMLYSLAKQGNAPASIDYTTVELAKIQTATTSSLETTHQSTDYNAINLYANYRYSWNDTHNLSLMGGFNQESSDWKKLYTYSYDMINEKYPSHSTATGENKVITDDHRVYTVRGAFYRVNYDYKGKYLFETNGRYDGSSKFPKKNRFGFFPSVSVGWNIARENFMKPVAGDWLSDLKLRGTWGQIGNQGIDPYKFVPTMSQVEKKDVAWLVNGAKPLTLNAPGLVSDSFTWETVETLDFGFDITALNGRLQSTFDWYRRDTKDMLAPGAELPSVVGASAPLQNTADLRTKGWELSLTWRDRIGAWGYNVGFNLYDSKTVVTKYHNESKIILKSDGTNNYYEGYEIGSIWGYVTDGYYTADDFEDTNTWKLKEGVVTVDGVSPRPGDIKYQNLRDDGSSTNRIDTGDGTFDNPGDRKIIGNNSLRLQYGINLGVNYKGFDLSVLLQGVGKRDVWISDARRWPFNSGQFGSLFKDQLDYWKPVDSANGDWTAANPNAEYFRIYGHVFWRSERL